MTGNLTVTLTTNWDTDMLEWAARWNGRGTPVAEGSTADFDQGYDDMEDELTTNFPDANISLTFLTKGAKPIGYIG